MLMNIIRNEPARVVAVVLAVLALLASFGLEFTDEQTGSIVAFVAAILALCGGEVTRAKVTPTSKLEGYRLSDAQIVPLVQDPTEPTKPGDEAGAIRWPLVAVLAVVCAALLVVLSRT